MLIRFLLALLMALPATDAFTAANGTALTTYSANWSLNAGNFAIQGNAVVANGAASTTECGARWNADTFPNDQYAQGTIASISGGGTTQRQGVGVRMATDNSANYYGLYYDDDLGEAYIFKLVGGTFTQLGATFTIGLVAGNKIRLEVVGTTLTFLLDTGSGFVSQGTRTDSALTSGGAGLTGKGISTAERIDDWQAGALETLTAIQPLLAKPLTLLRCRPLGPGNPLREVKYYDIPAAAAPGITIVTDVGALQLDGFSPTFGLPVTIAPNVGQLDLTGFAATFPTSILPGSGALSLTGFGPSIGLPRTIVPGFGQLTLTGNSPTFPRTIVPATGALTLTGFAPQFARTILPGFGGLVLDGFSPSFSFVVGGYTAQPGLGALTLAGFGPTIGLPRTIQPGLGALVLTGAAPAIGLPITVRPALGLLTLSGFGPSISFTPPGIFITPGTGQLTLTGYAPWIGTFTFRFAGGPVMTATITASGVLVSSISGGPILTGSVSGGPV